MSLRAALLGLSLALATPVLAQEGPGDWHEVELEELGFGEAARAYHTESELSWTFATRGDSVLTAAELTLETVPTADTRDLGVLRGLEVRINDEPVAELSMLQLQTETVHEIAIDGRLLSDTNRLSLRLLLPEEDPCGASVRAGTWSLVAGGTLRTRGETLPLSADLSVLPLPFYDPATDIEARIPVVLPDTLEPDTLRAAALTSAWWGLTTGSRVRFPVTLGRLPEGSAVVLTTGSGASLGLALPPVDGPAVSMLDHPLDPSSNAKLLVLHGPDAAAVLAAARGLLLSPQELVGETVALDPVDVPAVRRPYDAPRWLPDGRTVTFDELPGGEALVHTGLQGGTMGLDFRIAPDVFAWPRDLLRLTVDYQQLAPTTEAALVPTLVVELNGTFVQKLPRALGGTGQGTETVELHRSRLRGFNRLQVHVSWPESDRACDPFLGERVENRILPTSAIHLDELPHFAELPNVESFVEDGFPFTRRPDLAETVVVLPDAPSGAELGTFLSLMAHFAAVTGTAPHHVTLLDEQHLDEVKRVQKDLLVIGSATTLPGAAYWYGALPFAVGAGRLTVREPELGQQVLDLLGGHASSLDAQRAERLALRNRDLAAVLGARSPFAPDRSLVVVTSASDDRMPAVADLVGFTNADRPGGDVLLLADARHRFKLGPTFTVGEVDGYTRLRWALAAHWLALIPALLLAVTLLARTWRDQLGARERARLAEAGEGDPA